MSVANAGPEPWEPVGHEIEELSRRGNPSLMYGDDDAAGDMWAASTRATTVSHRFGGVRYALTRKGRERRDGSFSDDGGDSDASR